jgi:hypothetical protein
MIKIFTKTTRDIRAIALMHYEGLKPNIEEALDKSNLDDLIKRFLSEEFIMNVILSEPAELLKANQRFIEFCCKITDKVDIKELNKIFSYDKFIKKRQEWNAYSLTAALDVTSCPYCNRTDTKTYYDKINEIERPPLDHFFSQSKYPLLAISFFNLIPCCWNCNSIHKNREELFLTDSVHPYIEGFGNDARFSREYKRLSSIDVQVEKVELTRYNYKGDKVQRINKNARVFKLDIIYKDEEFEIKAGDTINKYFMYFSPRYKESLHKYSTDLREGEFRKLFESHWNEMDFANATFSKFRRDIVEGTGFKIE